MKWSAENVLSGKVVEIEEDTTMAKVRVDIGGGDIITVIVAGAAWQELDAKVGDELQVLKDTGVRAAGDLH